MHAYFLSALLLVGTASCTRAFAPVIVPIEFDGPTCGAGGPSVEIVKAHQRKCGKGDSCAVLDLHILNPTKRALWLMVDARSPFSGYLDSINILRSKYTDGPAVWEFIGQSYDQAFNLPPGADVVVRNLDYFLSPKELPIVFFHNLTLDFDRHIDWDNGKGTMPVRGDYDMHWLDDDGYRKEQLYPLDGNERVSLDTWCVQTLPITYRDN